MAFSYDTIPVFDPPCPVTTATPDLYSSPRIVPSSTFIPLVLVGRLGSLRVGVSGVVLELFACRACQYLFCKDTHPLRTRPGLTVHHETCERVDAVHNNETCKPSTPHPLPCLALKYAPLNSIDSDYAYRQHRMGPLAELEFFVSDCPNIRTKLAGINWRTNRRRELLS
jgi:hypothetical protein